MFSPSDYNDAVPQFTNGDYANEPLNPLYVEEPDSVNYKRGAEPLQTLPAQWWNWLCNKITAKLNKLNIYVKNIFNELAGLLSLVNVTPDATEEKVTTEQLKDMFATKYPQYLYDSDTFKTQYPQYLYDNFESEALLHGRTRGVIVAPTDTWNGHNTLSLTGGFGIINTYHKVTFSDCDLVIPNDDMVHYIVSNTSGVISIQNSIEDNVILIGLCSNKQYCLLIDNNPDQCKNNIILKKWFGQNKISQNFVPALQSYYDTAIASIETNITIVIVYGGNGISDVTLNNCSINIGTVDVGNGISSGTYNNCTINFKKVSGSNGISDGTYNNCSINIETVYGATGISDGTYNNCSINIESVNGGKGIGGGTFDNCTITIKTLRIDAGLGYGIYGGTFNNCTITIETIDYCYGIYGGTFDNCTITIKTVTNNGYGIYGDTFNNCTITIETVNSGSTGILNYNGVFLYLTYIKCSAITSLSNTSGKLNVLNDTVFHYYKGTAEDANSRFEYKDITDMFNAGTVSTDIANNDFSKYSVGNYIKKTITIPAYKNGTTDVSEQTVTVRIVFAHFNLFYTGVLPDVGTPYTDNFFANVMEPHVACVICDLPNCAMNSSNTTSGGYFGSYMHSTFLTGRIVTALSNAGISPSNHLVSHKKLLTTSINDSGYNRYGSNAGCSNEWGWQDGQYISLMSEVQLYGSIVWSSSGHDTGEANEKLALFNHIRPNKLFGIISIWLRDVASATDFAALASSGNAYKRNASNSDLAPAPLILLK